MYADLSELSGLAAPQLVWEEYPDWRPGCGSKSVEPGIAERLAAASEGSPLRARRIFVPHPIQDATDDELRAKADAIVEQVIDALVGDGLSG